MLDLEASGVAGKLVKEDLHVGRVGPVGADMPAVAETVGRLPHRHLAPFEFRAVGAALENPAANARPAGYTVVRADGLHTIKVTTSGKRT